MQPMRALLCSPMKSLRVYKRAACGFIPAFAPVRRSLYRILCTTGDKERLLLCSTTKRLKKPGLQSPELRSLEKIAIDTFHVLTEDPFFRTLDHYWKYTSTSKTGNAHVGRV